MTVVARAVIRRATCSALLLPALALGACGGTEGAVEPAARVYTISDHRVVEGSVQVDVDVAIPRIAEPLELVEVLRLVFVLREEEGVLRRTAG